MVRLPVDAVRRALLVFLTGSLAAGVASTLVPSSALASNLAFCAVVAALAALVLRKDMATGDLILAIGMFAAALVLLYFGLLFLGGIAPSLYGNMPALFDFLTACIEGVGLSARGGPDAPLMFFLPVWLGSVVLLTALSCSAGILLRGTFDGVRGRA